MSVFKCKMCGGAMEVKQGTTVCTCDYCGTQQTLPKLDDDRRAGMFDRANHFRRNNEFDKASGIFEQILNEDSTDAEAYWSLVLCRYGIEYVEDPATHKRLPTVNRAQYTSIYADEDYKAAIANADTLQKTIYEAEAKAIDEIQKGILAISSKEEPFDVFISFKETGTDGKRTRDAVLAHELYNELEKEGYKTFFAPVTLEDKLGTEYEPYIFAALNSAKVMVVLGTKPEHFNAVWVKNEWSRFLALIKGGAKKTLIPAYKDMDPYDLPEEFSNLLAQDMNKLGFMQDLLRGIRKIIDADRGEKTTTIKETVVVNNVSGNVPSGNISPLLKRAFMFLEDGDWNSANEYCEKVLDQDPENAQAYLGKLMADLHAKKKDQLKDYPQPYDNNINYQKVCRFDDGLKKELESFTSFINNRNETDRLNGIYNDALRIMNSAKTEQEYIAAAKNFQSISYKKSREYSKLCWEKAYVCRKDSIYYAAISEMKHGDVSSYERAVTMLRPISDWKDADDQIRICQEAIQKIKKALEEARAEEMRKTEEARIAREKTEKKQKRGMVIISIILLLAIAGYFVSKYVINPSMIYNEASALLENGKNAEAMAAFEDLNFKDSYEKYCSSFLALKDEFKVEADQYLANGDSINAAINYTKAGMPRKAEDTFDYSGVLKAGAFSTAGVSNDGILYYQSDNEDERGSLAIVQSTLKGTVRLLPDIPTLTGLTSSGQYANYYAGYFGNSDDAKKVVGSWVGIIDLYESMGDYYALMQDGTIKTYIEPKESSLFDFELVGTSTWENIASIQGFFDLLVGIDKDGCVFLAYRKDTSNDEKFSVASWENIEKVYYSDDILIGIKSDSTLCVAYNSKTDVKLDSSVLEYNDVVDIVLTSRYLAVLHKNGTVSMELLNPFSSDEQKTYYEAMVKEITSWNGIIALYNGAEGYLGIRYDGTVKYISDDITKSSVSSHYYYDDHSELKAEVEAWDNIVWIDTAIDQNWIYAVGLKADGTVISTGDGTYYTREQDTNGSGYHDVRHSDGNYNSVSSWKLW